MRAADVRALVASLLLSSSLALACACPALDFAHGVAASAVIFEGVVDDDPFESDYTDYVYVIRVTRVFKGDVRERVFATTDVSTCGVFPPRGDPWVFMFHPEAVGRFSYELSPCGIRSSPVSFLAASELASLGPGHPPRETPTRLLAASLLLTFGLAAVAWRVRRHRTKPA